jgi:hypothetical protein
MSIEKPNEKKFDKLLMDLSNFYDGEILNLESTKSSSNIWSYPTFLGKFKDTEFSITLNEAASVDSATPMDGYDNIDYLRIVIKGKIDG